MQRGSGLRPASWLDNDLRKAVSLLAPSLVLTKSYRELREDNGSKPIRRLGDIVLTRMAISDKRGAEDLIDTLCTMPDRAGRILDIATAQLQSSLELEVELDWISEDYDHNDSGVPSIEIHAQNKHHEGVNSLVRVLADFLGSRRDFGSRSYEKPCNWLEETARAGRPAALPSCHEKCRTLRRRRGDGNFDVCL